MKEIDFKIYKILLEQQSISKSNVSARVLNSDIFKNLLNTGILSVSKLGRGLKICVSKNEDFKLFFETKFPEDILAVSKSDNIRKFRNSKASKVDIKPIYLFRGFIKITINNDIIDIASYTNKFGLFSSTASLIKYDKICFVENLETFLNAEKLIENDFLFIHKYGRIGVESLSIFETKEVLVFVDYDFNGLDEYLRIKSVFKNAELFMPSNYDVLFEKYSKTLKDNKATMSNKVKQSNDEKVIKIREEVARTNKFLEQEILIYD